MVQRIIVLKTVFYFFIAIVALAQTSLASDTPCAEEIVPTVVDDYTYPADWFAPHLIMEIDNIVAPQDDDEDAVDADEVLDHYFLVLDANIIYLGGQADFYYNEFLLYYASDPVYAMGCLDLSDQYTAQKDYLIDEKNHWIRFKVAIEDIRNAPSRFGGGAMDEGFPVKFSYLKAWHQTGCIDPGVVPDWDTMPVNSAIHNFILAPAFSGNPVIQFICAAKAAAAGDTAHLSTRDFIYLSPLALNPVNGVGEDEITIMIDGAVWLQSVNGSLEGEQRENPFTIGVTHHVEVNMVSDAIDGGTFPSWTHDATMEMTLFSFDFTFRKEAWFDRKCELLANQ